MAIIRRSARAKKKNIGLYQASPRLSIIVRGPAAMARVPAWILQQQPPSVWLLRGPLGAGKTTLTRALLRKLRVGRSVTSPTFTLVKRYRLKKQPWRELVHIDAYRIQRPAELAALEIDELLADKKILTVIEWPERLRRSWGPSVTVKISHAGRNRRVTVTISRR